MSIRQNCQKGQACGSPLRRLVGRAARHLYHVNVSERKTVLIPSRPTIPSHSDSSFLPARGRSPIQPRQRDSGISSSCTACTTGRRTRSWECVAVACTVCEPLSAWFARPHAACRSTARADSLVCLFDEFQNDRVVGQIGCHQHLLL